jgi:ornithine carbamoyltransferase
MDVAIGSPADYTCPEKYVKQAEEDAKITGSKILMTTDPFEAAADADVIYTDTWTSMGQEAEKAQRVEIFKNYQVNSKLMGVAHKDAIFMHCLPAFHDLGTEIGRKVHEKFGLSEMEVTNEVFEGKRSVVFDEAENRMHTIKAVMYETLGGPAL